MRYREKRKACVEVEWLQGNKHSIRDIQEFATWQEVFEDIGVRYEGILPKTQER